MISVGNGGSLYKPGLDFEEFREKKVNRYYICYGLH